ncbi:hypothetical protein SUGI_0777540 [Cryptomeria japonica]|uniref:calmodulin-like protein 3 n=1 Tax=Cryptomeria japonica TaxID=3369 RepID=UPI002414CC84|nr:calmodulin-like protein 3 [Cryptomeria japonica]GLJ38194.1 hypothetical protein SUGI_0777540 [Cryptomeria japonica]
MSSILDVDESIIEGNWYYGCLFSPKKRTTTEAVFSTAVRDNKHTDVDRKYHDITDDEKSKQLSTLREESGNSSSLCFESSDSSSPKIFMKDVEEEDECLASMFSSLDEDGDGRVSSDEIVRFLDRLSLEMPKEEVELAVRLVSAGGDEFLTTMEFGEFYRIVFSNEEEVDIVKDEEKAICEAFNVFDQNGDGFISAMELADVLSRLGFVEGKDVSCCESMIESVDYNGDGFVDIHEFRHLITRTFSASNPCLKCVPAV